MILKRKRYEEIVIGNDISIVVTEINRETVSIAVNAPGLTIDRKEVAVAKAGGDGKAVAEEARRRRREARIVGRDQLT